MLLLYSITASGCVALEFKNLVICFADLIVGFVCTTAIEFSAIEIVGSMAVA